MKAQHCFGAVALLSLGALSSATYGQQRAIDTARSTLTVRVYKSGMFSAFGHDHEISAPIASGSVDPAARRVELRVRSAALQVRDPGASEKDRADIQQTMDSQVLEVKRYPEIGFRATSAQSSGTGSWSLHGDLTLHGETRPVTVQVRDDGGHYVGAASLRQSDFGIKPVKIAGGTVKVKDEVRVEFDIQLVR